MTWFKIDDGWAWHPKVRSAGRDGRGLWTPAGTLCAASNTDGVVSPQIARDAAFLAEVSLAKAAAALVTSGLWHTGRTIRACTHECASIAGRLVEGAYFFHDWLDYNPTKDVAKVPLEQLIERRHKRLLRDKELCQAIQLRDGPYCRYCACEIDFRDRKGPRGGTYDHVDPALIDPPLFLAGNSLDNVVSACRTCNGRKGRRTPAEARMPLLPAPGSNPDLARAGSELDPGRNGIEPDLPRPSRTHATPDTAGSGRDGTEPESNPGQIQGRSEAGAQTEASTEGADVLTLPAKQEEAL